MVSLIQLSIRRSLSLSDSTRDRNVIVEFHSSVVVLVFTCILPAQLVGPLIPPRPLLELDLDLSPPPYVQLISNHNNERYPDHDARYLSCCLLVLGVQFPVESRLDLSGRVSWSLSWCPRCGFGEVDTSAEWF